MKRLFQRIPRTLNWKAASLFVQLDPDWRQKLRVGGRWVFVPLIGWPIALGYRKVLIDHLRSGDPILPNWSRWTRFLKEGLRSMAVIFTYYSPLYLALGFLLIERQSVAIPWLGLIIFFTLFTVFLPLALPAILLSNFVFGTSPFAIEPLEALSIAIAFWIITFFIPSGFLQVSRTGRYLSAFNPWRVCSFVFRNFLGYLEAWIYSSLVSIFGHILVLRYPWTIFWSYQSILYSFNELLYHEEKSENQLEYALFNRLTSQGLSEHVARVKMSVLGVDLPNMEAS